MQAIQDTNHLRQPYDDELANQPWSQRCTCGKRFMQPNSYALHVGCCSHFKARLGKNLKLAKTRRAQGSSQVQETPNGSRKRKLAWIDDDNLDVDHVFPSSETVRRTEGPEAITIGDEPMQTALANERLEISNVPHESSSSALGRGHRLKRFSYKIQATADFQPSSALPISLFPTLSVPSPSVSTVAPQSNPRPLDPLSPPAIVPRGVPVQSKIFQTPANSFGLYKVVKVDPSQDLPYDPDDSITVADLREKEDSPRLDASPPILYPFPNLNSFRLGEWYWSDDPGKSSRSFRDLLAIVGSDDFVPADIREANWTQINKVLAGSQHETDCSGNEAWIDDGSSWISTSVTINVPLTKKAKRPGTHAFSINGFHYRPLVPIIKEKLESSTSLEHFHILPHELRWKPGEGKADVRVYGEMYNCPAFAEAYADLQSSPPERNCQLPRYMVGLMFASDSTMLATFGTAKLWPLYMYYANDSKYRRAKPREKLFETVAYFEKLPDGFKDFVIDLSGNRTVPQPLITHCQRELFHEQWKIILGNEFVEAYCHGIAVTCFDGVRRRFYPRIFTYSADYPEKILLASIKNLGAFPCPRCEIPMTAVYAMGQKRDRHNRTRLARVDDDSRRKNVSDARDFIYKKHYSITSEVVEARLGQGSWVPTDNTFSSKLAPHGFNLYRMLVVDLMHEVEIGVWKAVFIQLLRILEAHEKGSANKLDERFRSMPTFGKDIIRRFINNVSDMKQLAARDFEDLLQCAIPAFEGLFPAKDNTRIMQLLFTLASWHGLAKLRLHTDHTLSTLDVLTINLGNQLRDFVKYTCSKYETKELSREYQARKRREARQKKTAQSSAKKRKTGSEEMVPSGQSLTNDSRRGKTLNLNTYKFHALGDVANTIRTFGTTDSYSTQTPEGYHRFHKKNYKRTSKRDVARQLSRIQMRQARIRKLRKQLLPNPDEGFEDENTSELPYFLGKSQNNPVSLPALVQSKREDPAFARFVPKLKSHLLPRVYRTLLEENEKEDTALASHQQRVLLKSLVDASGNLSSFQESPEAQCDIDQLYFHSDRLYQHNVLNINYTSYDLRRQTDIINSKTSRRDVMCLRTLDNDESPSTAHHFVHARVLGTYHANIVYKGRGASDLRKRRFDLLFVRWFEFCDEESQQTSLDRLRLTPLTKPNAVGFVDPRLIIRASHIVPRFSLGPLYPAGTQRIASKFAKDAGDWGEYFVNRFVDRDMLMRHQWGHGVGHAYSHADAPNALNSFPDGLAGCEANLNREDIDSEMGSRVSSLGRSPSSENEHTLDNIEDEELDVDGSSDSDDSQSDGASEQDPDGDSDESE